MNEAVIADLKKFIVRIIAQQTADIRQDICRLDTRMLSLETKVDDGFAAIAEVLEGIHDHNDAKEAQLKDHDNRIVRLESHIA